MVNPDNLRYRHRLNGRYLPDFMRAFSRQNRVGLSVFVLLSVLWLQGSVLWHDTAHATHNHGSLLLCKIDVLIPDIGVQTDHTSSFRCFQLSVLHRAANPSPMKAAVLLAYLSRAPPQSSHRV